MALSTALTHNQIRNIQIWLAEIGFGAATLTPGVWDAATAEAVRRYQAYSGLDITGEWDPATQSTVERTISSLQGWIPTPEQIRNIQRWLARAPGVKYQGPIDGFWSPEVTASLKLWQQAAGVSATGIWDAETKAATDRAAEFVTKLVESRNGSALGELQTVLDRYDLGDLTEWAWQRILAGESQAEIMNKLRETSQFKTRFKAIDMRRDAGLPAISPEEVIQYEEQASALMRAAGMPRNFYNNPDDFASLLGNNISIVELGTRVNDMYTAISRAPVEIRNTFAEYFGANGDAALAAFFLDPERAAPELINMVNTANFAGTVRQFGFNPDFATAKRAADMGIGIEEARRGSQELNDLEPLFTETISETNDLVAEREGFNLVYGIQTPTRGPSPTGQTDDRQGPRNLPNPSTGVDIPSGPVRIPGDTGGVQGTSVTATGEETGAQKVKRRRQERISAMSGGGGPNVGQGGVRGFGTGRR